MSVASFFCGPYALYSVLWNCHLNMKEWSCKEELNTSVVTMHVTLPLFLAPLSFLAPYCWTSPSLSTSFLSVSWSLCLHLPLFSYLIFKVTRLPRNLPDHFPSVDLSIPSLTFHVSHFPTLDTGSILRLISSCPASALCW